MKRGARNEDKKVEKTYNAVGDRICRERERRREDTDNRKCGE